MSIQSVILLIFLTDEEIGGLVTIVPLLLVGFYLLRHLLRYGVSGLSRFFYLFYRTVSYPFNLLNGLQRHLSKPWRVLYKSHHGSDKVNRFMRRFWTVMKLPLYVLLAPLRLVNAIFYNIIIHVGFEFFNYLAEIADPTSRIEGGANFFTWLLLIPLRLVKYSWHFMLTVVESVIWTAIDTVVPALMVYHGTNQYASENITQSPGRLNDGRTLGTWQVGGGNYVGDGIYFAPVRKTATHYARNHSNKALIVCRVSLGKVLDLGMAPEHVYAQCGSANAVGVSDWGLRHGYTTGEWWRRDEQWWEYCMFDRGNRYNYSWRIRPMYVEELDKGKVHRIRGGMSHWLFRLLVLKDLKTSISEI